jgi:hypothetical protein
MGSAASAAAASVDAIILGCGMSSTMDIVLGGLGGRMVQNLI